MLTHIHIRDFVLVDQLELELEPGMTALTGETGAGKSILIDALGLALGDRADSSVVRHGCERAEIAVSFDLATLPAVRDWLQAQDLAEDDECHLRRVVYREGRSRAYLNGRPVPLQQLRELGSRLIDIHGQHEHQSLMRTELQRTLVDDYAGLGPLLSGLAGLYDDWKARREELDRLREAARERGDRLDLLRFQLQELEALAPAEGELERLDEEHARLAHASELIEGGHQALDRLYDAEGSIHGRLGETLAELQALAGLDPALTPVCELLNGALIHTQEAADALRHHSDRLEIDPQRLAWLEERIGLWQQLARKHRLTPAELPALVGRLRDELDRLEHADQHFERLEAEIEELATAYREQAARLGDRRRQAAAELGTAVSAAMQELGMAGGRFEIAVETRSDAGFARHGLERIEFRVSANPGQPLAPLARVASGGELSRISLAIQVIATDASPVPVLVFDEVDSGIGGGVAEVVGRQLRALGDRRQVLCVTHLPQVAAQAHQQLQVSKLASEDATRTRIRPLDAEDRVEEIARMLGGIEVTESTLDHAREMLARAGDGPKRRRKRK
ncbi:DNA repair protein RecN [Thiohalobacter sp. IOR34]|uniref:DNA repair protein RecN n=1 Tax=Thiohalobacter sp. IOR34 TaxID=3057176 RepID=UPI0025B27297|nr:DNA repair protein RecN [Thiohalobacter sp. IOR34]WJW76453.1 DNA repair protein RecN [Thiohalobacter sp. IOR34]